MKPLNSLSTRLILFSLMVMLALSACQMATNAPDQTSYTRSYETALQNVSGQPISQIKAEALTQNFANLYSQLANPDFDNVISQVYAEEIYFNDTMHEFATRTELSAYLSGLTKQVDSLTLEPIAVMLRPATSNSDGSEDSSTEFWVNWVMDFELSIGSAPRVIRSYGVSQFRVNEAGLINFHQDYWDPNNGLYRSLPWIGGLYRQSTPFNPR